LNHHPIAKQKTHCVAEVARKLPFSPASPFNHSSPKIYQISKDPITAKTVSHHFVSDGSRGTFYTIGLRTLKSAEFIKELGQ
jgi:hypothetical protein